MNGGCHAARQFRTRCRGWRGNGTLAGDSARRPRRPRGPGIGAIGVRGNWGRKRISPTRLGFRMATQGASSVPRRASSSWGSWGRKRISPTRLRFRMATQGASSVPRRESSSGRSGACYEDGPASPVSLPPCEPSRARTDGGGRLARPPGARTVRAGQPFKNLVRKLRQPSDSPCRTASAAMPSGLNLSSSALNRSPSPHDLPRDQARRRSI